MERTSQEYASNQNNNNNQSQDESGRQRLRSRSMSIPPSASDMTSSSPDDSSIGGYIYRQKTSEELMKELKNQVDSGIEPISYNINIENFTNPTSYPFVVRTHSNNSDILRSISNISDTSLPSSSKINNISDNISKEMSANNNNYINNNNRRATTTPTTATSTNRKLTNDSPNMHLNDVSLDIHHQKREIEVSERKGLMFDGLGLGKRNSNNKSNINRKSPNTTSAILEVDGEEDDMLYKEGEGEGEGGCSGNGLDKDSDSNSCYSSCTQSQCCIKVSESLHELFFSMLPPHVRRRSNALQCPTFYDAMKGTASILSVPYFPWMNLSFRQYMKYFTDDLIAGITVGILLVPQGLSYALVANLPPIYGLYTAIAGYIYTFFGTSGELNLGPVALVSLFLPEAFKSMGLSLENTQEAMYLRVQAGICLGTVVGCTLMLMGLFRLGNLMKYISPSVMTGFVTGSGIYIGFSQMKYMFGIQPEIKDNNYEDYIELFSRVGTESKKWPVIIGWVSYGAMLSCNLLKKAFPPNEERNKSRGYRFFRLMMTFSTLFVVIVSTLVSAYLKNNGEEIETVGAVPAGMNPFIFPNFSALPVPFSSLFLASIPCSILAYMESVSVARKYSIARGYNIDPTQELWAVGITNLIASFFSSYPPGGAFSRTAVAAESGVKSPLANVYTSLFVSIVLACATSLLYYVPFAVLGAVINVAVISLMDFGEMWRALWVSPVDFFVMFITFLITTFIDVEKGLEYGILVSMIVLLYQISKLDVESVGQLRTNYHHPAFPVRFKKIKSYPNATEHPEIRILRLTANLFFGNIGAFRDEYYNTITVKNHKGDSIRAIIVDTQGVAEVDFASLAVIDELIAETRKKNIILLFSEANERLVNSLEGYELLEDVGGREMVTLSVEDAFTYLVNKLEMETMVRAKGDPNRSRSNSIDDRSLQNIDFKNEDFSDFYPMKKPNHDPTASFTKSNGSSYASTITCNKISVQLNDSVNDPSSQILTERIEHNRDENDDNINNNNSMLLNDDDVETKEAN